MGIMGSLIFIIKKRERKGGRKGSSRRVPWAQPALTQRGCAVGRRNAVLGNALQCFLCWWAEQGVLCALHSSN